MSRMFHHTGSQPDQVSIYLDNLFDIPGVIIPKTGTVQNYSNLEIRL
ncbi:hypothetical protein [Paenibacillus sp. USHLN196]